jgi:hypothetical protein
MTKSAAHEIQGAVRACLNGVFEQICEMVEGDVPDLEYARSGQRIEQRYESNRRAVLKCYEAYRTNRGVTLTNQQVYELIHLPPFTALVMEEIAGKHVGPSEELYCGLWTIPELRARVRTPKRAKREE